LWNIFVVYRISRITELNAKQSDNTSWLFAIHVALQRFTTYLYEFQQIICINDENWIEYGENYDIMIAAQSSYHGFKPWRGTRHMAYYIIHCVHDMI